MNPTNEKNSTASTKTEDIGIVIDALMRNVSSLRRPFERRWYDNNFFDDGFHYKFIQRSTGKMVDLAENGNIYNPFRSIPKASKQIRTIVNALLQNEYVPATYPKRVIPENYPDEQTFQMAQQAARAEAKKVSLWLKTKWVDQEMKQLIAQLFLIASKESTSWLKIWPDAENEEICVDIVDGFDMFVLGQKHDRKDLPFMIQSHPVTITEIWANQQFDETQKQKVSPDNKYSESQVKEAYMRAKYGLNVPSDFTKTVLLREAYLTEYLNEDNMIKIKAQKNGERILQGRKKGDKVIRQVYAAGDVWLRDKYLALKHYPYIPLQLEPGPFYQTPLMERFIHSNKILDTIVSRIERYTNTMVAGAWQRRKGENHTPTNLAGGVVYEYETTPLEQLNIAPVPNYVFNFINLLNSFIAEQGMTTVGGNLPKGVRSGLAIEALKAQEINQLKTTDDQLTRFIKNWAETMLELADDYFIKPQEVSLVNQGQPSYFDVVGKMAYDKMNELGMKTAHLTPISKNYTVEIRSEAGLAYTPEAKKAAALQLANFMQAMTQVGVISPQIMQQFVINLLEAYNFGDTEEFMDMINLQNAGQLAPTILDQIKLAVAQVFADIKNGQATAVGPQGGNGQPPQGQPTQPNAPANGLSVNPTTNPQVGQVNPNAINTPMAQGSQGGVANA